MRNCKEMLCVIFAGVMLAVLMSGSLARESAKLAQCDSNLKKILQKLHTYVDTYEVMPPVWTEPPPAWIFWENRLDPKLATNPDWACPSDPRNAHMYAPADPLAPTTRRLSSSSYGMNERMHTYNSKKRRATIHDFVRPEKLIIFGDSKSPYLQPVQNPGFRRHRDKYHFITASGAIRLYSEKDLGGRKPNGHFYVKNELWTPWP